MDSVVHFEIPVDDEQRASTFYHEVFDWRLNTMPEMHYTMAVTGESTRQGMPTGPGRINGGLFLRGDEGMPGIEHPVVTIAVDDLDDAMERIRAHGGEIYRDRFTVEDMGSGAYFRDPEGNVVGLWQEARSQ
jgi:predicted enzyme related to lactoylglutathione lyase